MQNLLDLAQQKENTLFIIGNGFDRYHNLKTDYADFHNWLIQNRYTDVVEYMEKMFPTLKNGKPLLWQDFEKALGEGEPLDIHGKFFQGVDDGFFNPEVQNRVVERIKPVIEKIPELLRNWVKSLPVSDVERKPELDLISNESLYLSFNYTMLLEKVYSISHERILHIHHCLEDEKQLITGHRSLFSENDVDNLGNDNIEESCKRIAKTLNTLNKPVDKIIMEHSRFFNSLANITHVIVFGFSISSIDIPYFSEVFHRVRDDARWYFVCKDKKVEENYQQIIGKCNESLEKRINGYQYKRKMMPENCQYILINN